MDLGSRRDTYRAIEAYRGRPLIVYATSTRLGVTGRIGGDAVREFIDQIDSIRESTEVDILVHSSGGDALTAWKLMSILRERFDRVYVLVPYMAFSAATLFAMGADEIFLHPHSSLGPIDPQITVRRPDGMHKRFAYEDVSALLHFLSNEVKISKQVHLTAVMEKLFSIVDPVDVGAAKRASELSSSIGERLLLQHMTDIKDQSKARQIAKDLNRSFSSHGDAVSRTRAKELQLPISKRDNKLERLIWDAFLGIESHMLLRDPFDPIKPFLSDEIVLQMPMEVSEDLKSEREQRHEEGPTEDSQGESSGFPGLVRFTLLHAMVESVRVASEIRTEGLLRLIQTPDGQLATRTIAPAPGWRTLNGDET